MKTLIKILASLIFVLSLSCTKNYYESNDPLLTKDSVINVHKDYVYFSENPPDKLNQYAYVFQNRNPFTVSFWYNGTMTGTNATLFSISGNSYDIGFYMSRDGIGYRRFLYDGDDSNNDATGDILSYLSNALWYGKHHIVLTYDGRYQSLYVDGVFIKTQQSIYSINSPTISFRSENGRNWLYAGTISNAYFYTKAIDKDKVKQLYELNK